MPRRRGALVVPCSVVLVAWFLCSCAPAVRSCRSDASRLAARSAELQAIARADQADREDWADWTSDKARAIMARDVARRKRVGEIFGEGCFSQAEDYAAAALVFQHGDAPDHFLQAFLWAKRSVDLGDESQRRLMASAIDRYLINIGHKQLFASEAFRRDMDAGGCWCLRPVEPSFPDDLRQKIGGRSLAEALAWLGELNRGANCAAVECPDPLKPSPAGTVPGFW